MPATTEVVFKHSRYPALVLSDADGTWARFTEHRITYPSGEVVRWGICRTGDPIVIERLRVATLSDPDLIEVRPSEIAEATAHEWKGFTR